MVAGEEGWRRSLQAPLAIDLPTATAATGPAVLRRTALQVPAALAGDSLLAAVSAWVARVSGKTSFDLAYQDAAAPQAPGYLSTWVPLRLEAAAMGSNSSLCLESILRMLSSEKAQPTRGCSDGGRYRTASAMDSKRAQKGGGGSTNRRWRVRSSGSGQRANCESG